MAAGKTTPLKSASRMVAYLLAVMLVFSAVSILCEVDTIQCYPSEDGVIDLTGIDFDRDIVTTTFDAIHIYDYAFYMPEDFASGSVTQEAMRVIGVGPTLGDYGTIRILLRLPAGNVYAVSAKNTSYAQRMFIDGKEYPPIGVTGDSADAVTPKTMRYTVAFQSESDITEIILHYSNFVHSDTGGYYLMDFGHVNNIVRSEQLKTLRSIFSAASLVTAALFFFGMFLFFQRSRYFLWFSLACGCIAVRGLLTGDKALMLLLPDLNWYLAIRLEYLLTCGMALFAALYLNALFPHAGNKWAVRGFAVDCVLFTAFVCITQPLLFTQFSESAKTIYAAFCAYLLLAGIIKTLLKKATPALPGISQALMLVGFFVYVLLSALGINAHKNAYYLWGLDYPQVGMMAFLFLNILALVLGFARTERELDEARRSEREMEETNRTLKRLNRVRLTFLNNFTHEMKTPLAGIDALAQYTQARIRSGMADGETDENLADISQRAVWLAGQVDILLKQSVEQEDKLDFAAVPIHALFRQASAETAPLLQERGNCLVTETDKALPPLSGNADMLLMTLRNLIGNANRHSKGRVILLTARARDGMAEIRITDHGTGIPDRILHSVFLRGVSGDGSSGLGLAICKEAVETHGGTINITSTEGKGTEVWFTIPFAKEEVCE